MANLTPVLQREIDARVTEAARHAIAMELANHKRIVAFWRLAMEDNRYGERRTVKGLSDVGTPVYMERVDFEEVLDRCHHVTEALCQLARYRFPREHGTKCMYCGVRSTIRLGNGSITCGPCAEMVEDSWMRGTW